MSLLFKPVFLLCAILGLMSLSCVNLKHISEFSEKSLEKIEVYETLPSGFYQVCQTDCRRKNIRDLDIHDVECTCSANKRADSITRVIYKSVTGYFYGLKNISANELTKYRTKDLGEALATGNFGPLQLNEEDVRAYSKISTIAMRAFTDGYRRAKIKNYVSQAHEPLTVLIHFLQLNLGGNLIGKLEVQKSILKNFYFDQVSNQRLSIYERTKFAEDYFNNISEINAKQDELKDFTETLKTIAEGHLLLYTNINDLSDEQVKNQLASLQYRLQTSFPSYLKSN